MDVAAATGELVGDRIRRHALIDRLYHWVMAATVLVLMFSAFWPTVFQDRYGGGVAWSLSPDQHKETVMSTTHWIAGVVLVALVLFHIVRALIWQDWRAMFASRTDFQNIGPVIARRTGRAGAMPRKPGKYNGLQKLFHLGVALFILALVGTGLVMLFKIGTPVELPFQVVPKNPYILESVGCTGACQGGWDALYAIHGLAAAAMVGMVLIHIYFAARPDEWHLTRSMFRGWIRRDEYLRHHDTARWVARR